MILKGRNKHIEGNKIVFRKRSTMDGKTYQAGDEVPNQDSLPEHYIKKMFRHNVFEDLKESVEKTSKEPEKDPEEDNNKAVIVEDTEEAFKVEYKGMVREISRNQLREDGTLTKGGLKAFNS